WDEVRQASFEARIARITASCGLPLTWVENVEVVDFFAEFIPSALVPSRTTLGNRIIPAELHKFRDNAQNECKGKLATVQCDGYTASNQHHLVAFMITVGGKVYTIRAYDTSDEPKTAANLFPRILEIIDFVEKEWAVAVVAVTSDCSGESRAARAEVVKARPKLVGPDCYAHQ
ncbi:hypothetical protein C8Q70DRAFT_890671, partial [Cubamyces menziesii]